MRAWIAVAAVMWAWTPCPGQATRSTDAATQKEADAQRAPLTAKQIFEKCKGSVVTVTAGEAQATGFFQADGNLWTCWHVARGSDAVTVRRADGTEGTLAWVAGASELADSVLLYDGEITTGLTFAAAEPEVGDPLYVIGSPQGLEQTLTEGLLSGRRTVGEIEYLQLSAAVSRGSSGSPVLNRYGEVVGMVTGYLADGQMLNFAVSAESMGRLAGAVPLGMLREGGEAPPSTTEDTLVAMARKIRGSELAGCPDFGILVEGLPEAFTGAFTRDDVRGWVEAELARSAPKARVLTEAESEARREEALPAAALSDMGRYLREKDRRYRFLYVRVSGLKSLEGTTVYTVAVEFKRQGIVPSGSLLVGVWDTGVIGLFGSARDPATTLREAVQKLVKEFADAWVVANKEEGPDTKERP